ncbi:MAG: hypothetical protein GF317_22075 [Candidatus Lokiarchaeota archaeon]|nr:hypothetical protein [Candidatus Lokiarchaeota archaeon]MBD3202149.1 hypothetical protein [Candidatus Lokiarchaeota archaeon]
MMFLYAFIQKATQNKIQKNEMKMKQAYDRAELYKDLFSHDVKNIFQNILSANELLKYYLINNKEEKSELFQIIEMMEDQVIRGKKLAQNVYKISNMQNNDKKLTKINVIKHLENSISYTLNSFRERNINIEFEIPEKPYFMFGNDLLIDVFENLLMNAIMHNDKRHIMIKVKVIRENTTSNQTIRIVFLDNGPGIPDTMKRRIFERPIDLKEKKGIGLGLFLVKNIIETFNGAIWVENNNEANFKGGSKFVIIFPVV